MAILQRFSLALLITLGTLGGAACADEPVPAESAIEAETGVIPDCPPGTLVHWEEPYGYCGSCGTAANPGQLANRYFACAGDLENTTRLQNAKFCVRPCELL